MTAGSAVSSGAAMNPLDVAGDLPCADFGLLLPLKRSVEYAAIRWRVADPKPVDAWRVEALNYFLFQLRPAEAGTPGSADSYALFTMRWEDDGPLSAVVVTSLDGGAKAKVSDLRARGVVYTVHLRDESGRAAAKGDAPSAGPSTPVAEQSATGQ